MKIFTIFLLLSFMHIPSYAQQHSVTKNSLFTISKSLAYEMGKTYQLAQNCAEDLDNITSPMATTLFLNYFEEHEVKIVMKQYEYAVTQENEKSCNRETIEIQILINKIGDYMRKAAPFTK